MSLECDFDQEQVRLQSVGRLVSEKVASAPGPKTVRSQMTSRKHVELGSGRVSLIYFHYQEEILACERVRPSQVNCEAGREVMVRGFEKCVDAWAQGCNCKYQPQLALPGECST